MQRCLAFLMVLAASLAPLARADGHAPLHWLLIEAQLLPEDCEAPQACLGDAVHLLRNYLALTPDQVVYLTTLIDSHSTIREQGRTGAPPIDATGANIDLILALHDHPMADKTLLLRKHPGVFFDRTKLDAQEHTAGFADYVLEHLDKIGLKVLSEEELELTPGRPSLAMRVSQGSESAGCRVPFSVSISITEEVVMVRNPSQKMTAGIFATSARENLANTNHTLRHALEEAVDKLA
ncbi:MAG: hypothetical protein AAFR93_17430, partial [Pseudomonadota bacterium]